jgi:hypothetical protein
MDERLEFYLKHADASQICDLRMQDIALLNNTSRK